ncbi:cation:dicarboxylase symporter family transporter [Enterococcus sp. 669A]|uniref:L-cystine uptake protein TcyP n=1 Tax=Candidatus Enterococcus moelleringii TaxID=2815325 RepID=A0ABS3LDB2_9ENTE|nr:cation:dicarboxylase symporter family transporter [Enterococcus sp. 669A]MBO1307615.1 cation:dicarboxylase symporter family transporter [Enterococcus sp. 669A]
MLIALSFVVIIAAIYGLMYLKSKKVPFSKRVVLALVLGIVIGIIFNQLFSASEGALFSDWVGMFGSIYVKLLQMIAMPLILVCVILAFTKIEIKTNVVKIGVTIVSTLIITAGLAGIIGIATGYFANIDGSAFNISQSALSAASDIEKNYVAGGEQALSLPQKIVAIFPSNPFYDLTGQRASATLGVVIFALFLGVAYLRIKDKKPKEALLFKNGMDSIYEIIMSVVRLFLSFAPYAVLTIMTTTVVNNDLSAVWKLAQFFVACYVAMLIMMVIQLAIMAFCGVSPIRYLKKALPVLSFAFITASSAGSMAMNLEMQEELGIPKGISSLSASFATSMGMNGCAGLYPGIIIAIVAMTQGINPLSPQFLFYAAFMIAMTSFGIAGTGGGGTVATIITLSALGLPVGLAGVFIAIEPLVDMGRTVVNLNGGVVASMVTCKTNGVDLREPKDTTLRTEH